MEVRVPQNLSFLPKVPKLKQAPPRPLVIFCNSFTRVRTGLARRARGFKIVLMPQAPKFDASGTPIPGSPGARAGGTPTRAGGSHIPAVLSVFALVPGGVGGCCCAGGARGAAGPHTHTPAGIRHLPRACVKRGTLCAMRIARTMHYNL